MRWFAALAAVLVVLLVVAEVGANAAPWLLQPALEAAASRALGETVTIATLRLRPRWPPVVVASDVRAQGLGTLAVAEAEIAPTSLLTGRPRIAVLRLVRPDLTADAGAIARLLDAGQARRKASRSVPAASLPAAPPSGPAVARVVIDRGRLQWSDPRTGRAMAATVSGTIDMAARTVALQAETPAQDGFPAATLALRIAAAGPLHADLAFAWRGVPVRVAFDVAAPEQAVRRQPTPVSFAARASGATLTATVTATGTLMWPRYDLGASLHATDASAQLGAGGAMSANADAAGDLTNLSLHALSISSPQGDLAGDLALAFGAHPGARGHLAAQRLDLDALLALLPARPPRPSTGPAGPAPPPPPTVIPDRPLPFAALARGEADLTLSAASLRLGGVNYSDLSGHLVLQDGRLALDPFAAALPGGGRLAARLHVDAAAAPPTVALDLQAPALAIGPLLAALHQPDLASGIARVDASLHGSGATLHRLAATLAGTAALHVEGGTLDGGLLDLLLRRAHLPAPRIGGRVAVTCAAVGAVAAQGVLALAPLVADTARLRLDGAGQVDLGRETMDLPLRALLRTGPGLAFPVHVAGPWRAPMVTLGAGSATPPAVDSTSCPAPAPVAGHKPPKPIDILRGLLR